MALLNDILEWSKTIPLWQQDAIRELFQTKNNPTPETINRIYELFKREYGLIQNDDLKALPLSEEHIQAQIEPDTNISLKALTNLKHVNRIAENQTLPFYKNGLTIIYGDNGTGKSGYARLMKHACRARGELQPIYPDLTIDEAPPNSPEATFIITHNDEEKEITWNNQSNSDNDLSKISVFDSSCARAYLTKEQDVAYLPYGLDIVENLANIIIPQLSKKLEQEIQLASSNIHNFDLLKGETAVGKIFNNLNENTDEEALKKLGTLNTNETERLQELNRILNTSDPLSVANNLKAEARRIISLSDKLEEPIKWVKQSAIEKLRELINKKELAENSEHQVIQALHNNEALLPDTGGEIWKAMFEAARSYSLHINPDSKFPNNTCMLCQEVLPPEASHRLERFEDYVQNQVSVQANASRKALTDAQTKITNSNLDIQIDPILIEQLKSEAPNIIELINSFQKSIEVRKRWMLSAKKTDDLSTPPDIAVSPRYTLRKLAAASLCEARKLFQSSDEEKRKKLTLEFNELQARQNLSQTLALVLNTVSNIKLKYALETNKSNFDTTPISRQAKKFAKSSITENLKAALDDEFRKMKLEHIKTKVKDRNSRGQVYHRLLLDIPSSNKKTEEILSEGEQRAISLSSFFAELSLANHSCGIIFDDPISSLDHYRRELVAKRLIEESTVRQVIIFTHEVVFLQQLQDECFKKNIKPKTSHLGWLNNKCGVVFDGLPWIHEKVKSRLNELEQKQQKLADQPWSAYPSHQQQSEIRGLYDLLRATIERFIETKLFCGTIIRFRAYINGGNLKNVVGIKQEEINETQRLLQKCHDTVNAHDPSSVKNNPAPTPDELKRDLEDFANLISAVNERSKS
ncbi:MAG: AAA family ATPase [Arenicella sp.]